MNQLVSRLLTIKHYAKDLHYAVKGEGFYGDHLFMDMIADPIDEQIDKIKEVCLLGSLPEGIRPLQSIEYEDMAAKYYPEFSEENISADLKELQSLIERTLEYIEQLRNLSKGSQSVIDEIAQHLQKANGLLNLRNI